MTHEKLTNNKELEHVITIRAIKTSAVDKIAKEVDVPIVVSAPFLIDSTAYCSVHSNHPAAGIVRDLFNRRERNL